MISGTVKVIRAIASRWHMKTHIEIDGWSSSIRFSACHMLLRHNKCSRLHGHTYSIHLRLYGEVDKNHILVDFGIVKRTLRKYAEELDHKTLIATENRDIRISEKGENGCVQVDMLGKLYSFPREDVLFLPVRASTVEELSRYLLERLVSDIQFPRGIQKVSLGIDEGRGQGAWSTITLPEGDTEGEK